MTTTKKRRVEVAEIYDDQALLDLEAARDALRRADAGGADIDPLRAAVERATEGVRKTTLRYTFGSIGRREFLALKKAHPPTDTDHDAARKINPKGEAEYAAETFAPALILASNIEPGLSAADVDEMFHGKAWNEAELSHLFTAALKVQLTRTVVVKE